jgi:hypothetical protein
MTSVLRRERVLSTLAESKECSRASLFVNAQTLAFLFHRLNENCEGAESTTCRGASLLVSRKRHTGSYRADLTPWQVQARPRDYNKASHPPSVPILREEADDDE